MRVRSSRVEREFTLWSGAMCANHARTSVPSDLTESAMRFAQSVVVDAAGITHPGLVRTSNEDHFLIGRIGRYFETVSTSLPDNDLPVRADDAGYALIVADGMGGHAAGEVASRLAIREMIRLALALPDWIVRLEDSTLEAAAERAQGRIASLNAMVIEQGQRSPELRGMGCTLTAARNLGRVLQIAHVGDSRAYLLRADRLHRLTRDHTYVQMLVDHGLLAPEAAAKSQERHVLVNAVGGSSEGVQVDVERVPLANGDRVLLCSDGLTDAVDDEAIRAVLADRTSAAEACKTLVEHALAGGGRDNITVIVASYTWREAE